VRRQYWEKKKEKKRKKKEKEKEKGPVLKTIDAIPIAISFSLAR